MKAKVKSLMVSLRREEIRGNAYDSTYVDTLSGNVNLEVTGGQYKNKLYITATQNIPIQKLSQETQDQFLQLVKKIESELND